MSPALISVAVTLVVVAVVAAVVALTGGGAAARRQLPVPVPWLLAGVALLLVGVVVMPRLLGFTFLLLPMIWSRSIRRRPGGPGSSGPEHEHDPFDEDR